MRVLLASPESKTWSSRKHIPLGLGYLGAVLEGEGHEVQLWDGAVEKEPLTTLLDKERFDLVGITSVTPLIHEAWEAARDARDRDAITILGGPHPTLLPGESLERPDVDMVVRGEAEDTIIEITRALAKDRGQLDVETGMRHFASDRWDAIAGLSFRDATGETLHNPPREPRRDLDSLPFPAHHLYRIERYT
ncbi:MAG: cobalamin-dependent protein, partial [Anaerolineae bacterium]